MSTLQLNVKRTTLVGLAFLSICALWQMYDFTIPLVLKNTYHLGDTLSGVVMAMDNILALFLLPFFGSLSDRTHTRIGRRMPFIIAGTAIACILLVGIPYVIRNMSLAVFLITLMLLLLAMGTYRSPAVALMPDVTPKPLRSKANAIINLLGAVGGVIALGLIQTVVIRTVDPVTGATVSDYSWLFWSIALIMAVCVFIMALTIQENPLTAEMEAIHYGEDTEEKKLLAEAKDHQNTKRSVLTSLLLILFSVFLWFMGYNAVTTAFSKYAMQTWNTTEGTAAACIMLASIAAIVSYWPVGILSSRFGRKRIIQLGVLLLGIAFGASGLFTGMTPFMYVLFALVGIAWACINVNSFPMVVELATGEQTGKYTGYYYTFSMAAQVLTPILSGYLMEHIGYHTLFPYAAIMVFLSLVTISLVKHGDNKPAAKHGLEALDVDA